MGANLPHSCPAFVSRSERSQGALDVSEVVPEGELRREVEDALEFFCL